jgi:hypothetical protein
MTNEEFDKAHGGNGVVHDEIIYYADGATRENLHHGMQYDPPTDPLTRARNVRVYWEQHRHWARVKFTQLKHRLQAQAVSAARGTYTAPREVEIVELEELQKRVKSLDKKWQEAVATEDGLHPQRTSSPGAERARAMQQQIAARAGERIKALEI